MDRASRTALGAALYRAAHQLRDVPPVFADPLALRIVGPEAERALRGGDDSLAPSAALRAFVAVRSRFAEDCVAAAHARGVRQAVVLGAGLDTFAYRNALPGLAVVEVDHPATQAWKRARLAEAGIAIPPSATYAAVDFEREPLRDGLARAGLDASSPASFSWLGVTPYLGRETVMGTLAVAASFPAGSEIVLDYVSAADAGDRATRALAARVAAVGEPFRSAFDAAALAADLRRLGFSDVEDLGPDELQARYLRGRGDALVLRGRARLVRARV